jgi:hypothetical protein
LLAQAAASDAASIKEDHHSAATYQYTRTMEGCKYQEDVVGEHVVVKFLMGPRSKKKREPILGQIVGLRYTLEKNLKTGHKTTTMEHLITFQDGDKIYMELQQLERQHLLTWVNNQRNNNNSSSNTIGKRNSKTAAAKANHPSNKDQKSKRTKAVSACTNTSNRIQKPVPKNRTSSAAKSKPQVSPETAMVKVASSSSHEPETSRAARRQYRETLRRQMDGYETCRPSTTQKRRRSQEAIGNTKAAIPSTAASESEEEPIRKRQRLREDDRSSKEQQHGVSPIATSASESYMPASIPETFPRQQQPQQSKLLVSPPINNNKKPIEVYEIDDTSDDEEEEEDCAILTSSEASSSTTTTGSIAARQAATSRDGKKYPDPASLLQVRRLESEAALVTNDMEQADALTNLPPIKQEEPEEESAFPTTNNSSPPLLEATGWCLAV